MTSNIFSRVSYSMRMACPKRLALIVGLTLALFAPKLDVRSGADDSLDPQDLAAMVADLTPGAWKIYDKVKRFTPDNLYTLIDGGAELYLAYDLVGMTFATFEKSTDTSMYIELSVYDMGTPSNAFGVFSVQRSQDLPPLDLGRAGYRSGANYYIWQGRYYVTIVSLGSTEEMEQTGLVLARKVTAFLADSGEPVWGMAALPQADLVPNSVKYFKADAMGLDFMRNTYTARYRRGNLEISVFLSQKDSAAGALTTVARYARYAEDYGEGVQRLTQDKIELVLCDLGGNFDVIFQKGRLVGGVISVGDRHLATLAAIDFWEQLVPCE